MSQQLTFRAASSDDLNKLSALITRDGNPMLTGKSLGAGLRGKLVDGFNIWVETSMTSW